MSEFRNQFHAAQLRYHCPLYPDDLASQILPAKRNFWPLLVGTLVAGAAGAIIAVVVINELVVPPPQRSDRVVSDPPAAVMASMPGLPEMPKAQDAVEDQPVFLPALPSFPSLADVLGGVNAGPAQPDSSGTAGPTRESL